MAQINFRIDDETKRRAEEFFNGAGLTMSGAIMIFIQQTLNMNEIPFPIRGKMSYHEKLLQAKQDWENGRKNFHEHDLIEVDDEKAQQPASRRA